MQSYAVSYTTYMNHGCRCEGCTDDHRLKHREWRHRAMTGEQRQRANEKRYARAKVQNAAMPTPNTGKPFTDEDKAIALDLTLTARQAAEKLGRSMFSIKEYRRTQRKAAGG